MLIIERRLVTILAADEAATALDDISDESRDRKDDDAAIVSDCGSVFSDEHGRALQSTV